MDVFFPFVFKASQCYGQLLIAKQLRRSGLKQMAQKWQKLVKADGSLKIFLNLSCSREDSILCYFISLDSILYYGIYNCWNKSSLNLKNLYS